MRLIARMGLVATLFSVAAGMAVAREPFRIPGGRPTSIREVVDVLRGPLNGEDADEERHLQSYLENTQCGGWDRGAGVEPYIAEVHGLPGREHDWNGNVLSGMATRVDGDGDGDENNDYTFPERTRGLGTVCAQNTDRITKTVWAPVANWVTIAGENVVEYGPGDHVFAHPYFEDPSCRWRWQGGGRPPEPLPPDGAIPPSDKDSWETEDERSCTDFCEYVNSFLYQDCLDVQPRDIEVPNGVDADGRPVTREVRINVCAREGWRYICSDGEVDGDRAAACAMPHPAVEEWANARACTGEQCRCPNTEHPGVCITTRDTKGNEHAYQSFYRTYEAAGYERDALAHAPQDQAVKNMEATCFGFYNEFDPRTHQTTSDDRRCVINIDVSTMHETQVGKATYQEGGVQDRDPTDASTQRPGGLGDVPGEFDRDEDTWYKKLGNAFSFVNDQVFREKYNGDLANVYLAHDALDDGQMTATPQISPATPLAQSNTMRAFDDTGEPRVFSTWWQEQQTRMASLVHPSVLRIVLPNAWFMGLDANDPFIRCGGITGYDSNGPDVYDYGDGSASVYDICPDDSDAGTRANRADRVELQIEADEDALGMAMAYLERSLLLHIEEEPIHVVVPLGSPVEFRARGADWCNWYKSEYNKPTCADAPQEIRDVIDRLEEYAATIDEYRALRAELAEATSSLLDLQGQLLEPIAAWFADHEEELTQIIEGGNQAQQQLLPLWNDVQAAVAVLHEHANLPWCMNQRFTSPLLTQLDAWLPSRGGPNAPITADGLPTLPEIDEPEDVIIDFSAISAMSGTIKLPVLKPVQIRIDIPTPPVPAALAPLPSMDDVRVAIDAAMSRLPTVDDETDAAPPLSLPQALDAATMRDASQALTAMQDIVLSMGERYDRFWKSIGPLKPGEEQFDRQIEFKTQMKCRDFNELPCDHPEMNLLEIVQRIGSRPLVQLSEDFDSVGPPRADPLVCPPEDHACHLLHPERTDPRVRLEIHGSVDNEESLETLRSEILTLTQPPPIGSLDPLLLQPHAENPSPVRGFRMIHLLP